MRRPKLSAPTRTACGSKGGSAGDPGTIMVMVLVALPVILLLLLATTELAMRFYYKAQVHSAATAATLAAIGTQTHWPIPVPTEFAYFVPVEGFFINTLHLPNVDDFSHLLDWDNVHVDGEAKRVVEWTGQNIKFKSALVAPGTFPSPIKWVKITTYTEVPGVFSKIFRQDTVEDSACGLAWIRPDYWYVKSWWSKQSAVTLGLMDTDKEFRYYRLIPCGLGGVPDLVEVVAEAHLAATGEDKKAAFQTAKNDVDSPPDLKDRGEGKDKVDLAKYESNPVTDHSIEVPKAEERANNSWGNARADRIKSKAVTVTCWDGSTHPIDAPITNEPGREPSTAELKQQYCPPEPPKESPPPATNGH